MLATAIHVAAAAGLGGMAGLLGGLFGVGGGFLVIPLLGFFYGMDQQTAQGTALIMVVPNVLWALSRYRRRFGIDLRMAAAIAGSALIAAYPTARFTTGLDPHFLRLAFAVFLATTAGTVAYRTWRGGARVGRGRRRAWGWVTAVGVVGGVAVLRSRWGFHCPAAADDVLRIAAIRGPRSGPGARVPECAPCFGGLCRGRSGRLACRITARAWWNRCDLGWRRVCEPPARETGTVGLLRTLAPYRGPAGAAGVIKAGHLFEKKGATVAICAWCAVQMHGRSLHQITRTPLP